MSTKTIHVLVVLAMPLVIARSYQASAQQQTELKPLRFEVTPFVGYRTGMAFPVEPHVSGTNPRVVLDSSPSYGVSFGIRRQEDDLIEIRWARQDSHIHSVDITPPVLRQSLVLDQFHGDFSHEPYIENWVHWARPYVLASVGGTHVSGIGNISATRFSLGIGAGIRFFTSRHLGFKIQAEWVPVFTNPNVAFTCGPGCILHVGGALSSQGEVLAGPLLRF